MNIFRNYWRGKAAPATPNSFCAFPLGLWKSTGHFCCFSFWKSQSQRLRVRHWANVASNRPTFCWMMERETIHRGGVFKKKEGEIKREKYIYREREREREREVQWLSCKGNNSHAKVSLVNDTAALNGISFHLFVHCLILRVSKHCHGCDLHSPQLLYITLSIDSYIDPLQQLHFFHNSWINQTEKSTW